MQGISLRTPDQFNFKVPDDWPRWRRRFEQFRIASGLSEDSNAKQISTLLYCLGEEADSVLDSTNPTAEDRRDFQRILGKFDSFFKVRRNIIFERARFNRRNQLDDESAETYIMELYTLAEHCEFTDKEERIRDRLVVGIRDTALSEQLQTEADLTLDKAKKKIRQREAVHEQQQLINGTQESKAPTNLDEVRSNRGSSKRKPKNSHHFSSRRQPSKTTPLQQQKNCGRCGKGSHKRDQCPAKEAVCHRCHKKGHYSSLCFSKSVSEVTTHSDVSTLDSAFLDSVSQNCGACWTTEITLCGKETTFKIDTGAEVTAISDQTYETLITKPRLKAITKHLYGPSQTPLTVLGQFKARLLNKDNTTTQDVYVVQGLKSDLLGLPAVRALNLVKYMDSTVSSADNRARVERKFPTLFQGLGNFGEPYRIQLKADAIPHAIFTPRRVPLPLRTKVQAELDKMESMGIITKVDTPTSWCAGMVVVPKQNGSVRICVDLKALNEGVMREVHPLPKVDETLAQMTGARIFSKLDANSGFWQIPLAEESQLLTTFLTPFGRYCFRKLPFGICSAPEHFQRRMSIIVGGLEGVLCLMDDILIYGKDEEEHNSRLDAVLQRLQEAGVTLNPEKCEFNKTSIIFLGHLLDEQGIRPDPQKAIAIKNMAPPTNVSELRRFMGMANQLGKFSSKLATVTQPLRELLQNKTPWHWGLSQEKSFQETKTELIKPTILTLYDPKANTKISADASSYGLGAVLLQRKNQEWKPVSYASRSLNETEKRYAQIEKEGLAITWSCEKFSPYILGKRILIETDHKPLVSLFGVKDLDKLPPRILRFRLRLARFDYSIIHVPGKHLYTADTLSRAPQNSTTSDTQLIDEAELLMTITVDNLPASEQKLKRYKGEQLKDPICSKVVHYCQTGWPSKQGIENHLKPYWEIRGEFTLKDSLLMRGNRIVVPKSLQKITLHKIHEGHQGIERCRLRAKISVWWPEISQQIKDYIRNCPICVKSRQPQIQPMIASQLPKYPWQRAASDLFQLNGFNYLVVVDYFSRYPEVVKLRTTTSRGVIDALKAVFSRHGIPQELISDNGPQYSSEEFATFAKDYDFIHTTSSPRYPQSNGQAERTVQTLKSILEKADDQYLALLSYRATPFPWCGLSPAELCMGRSIRSNLPQTQDTLCPNWSFLKRFREDNEQFKERQRRDYDKRHRTRFTSESINPGTKVWVTSGNMPVQGRVVQPTNTPRSYIVETSNQSQIRRNQSHLNIIPDPPNCSTTIKPTTPGDDKITYRYRHQATRSIPIVTREKGRCGTTVDLLLLLLLLLLIFIIV